MAFVTLTPLKVFIFLASQWPYYFPGNPSPFGLQECHLSRKPLWTRVFAWSQRRTAAPGFLHLGGQQPPAFLLPEPSPGPPPCTFGWSLSCSGERNKPQLLYSQQWDSGFQELTSTFEKKESTPRKVWGICLKGKSMAPRRMCYSPTLVLDLAPICWGNLRLFEAWT